MALLQAVTDVELVQRSLDQDAAAFDELVRRFTPVLYNQAYLMTRSVQEAEDCAQETLIKAYKRLKSLKSGEKFSAWLMTINRNTVLTSMRRNGATDGKTVSLSTTQVERPAPGAAEQVGRDHLHHSILDALDTLDDKYRLPILLHYMEGRSYQDIAQRLGWSVPELKGMMVRGMEKLRKELRKLHQEFRREFQQPKKHNRDQGSSQ